MSKPIRNGLIAFLAALIVIIGAFFYQQFHSEPGTEQASVAIGGPFALTDQNGAVRRDADFRGKLMLIYFGYTFCPDVCPTTLQDIAHWITLLGSAANQLNYIFVTIDPQHDTPRQLHAYLSSFDRRIRGFTGTSSEITRIAKEYGVYFKRVPGVGGTYSEDHSSRIYLMDGSGKFIDTIGYQEPDESAMRKIELLIARGR